MNTNIQADLLLAVTHHLHKFYEDGYDPQQDKELLDLIGPNEITIQFGCLNSVRYEFSNGKVEIKHLNYKTVNYRDISLTLYVNGGRYERRS